MTAKPSIEFVIAVHDEMRPLRRAVESALVTSSPDRVGVVVVAHNLPDTAFAADREHFVGRNVRWLSLNDGTRTPAAPFNHGVAAATATFVGVMGSDDRFDPGAVDKLLELIDRDAPDGVIYPLRKDGEKSLPNPLVRRGRERSLDPVRDRMAYRTAPLALVSRQILQDPDFAFGLGLPVGEDAMTSAKLWFGGFSISFRPHDPGYVIMDDGPQRVTLVKRPAETELAAYRGLITSDWFASLSGKQRTALVTKIARVHLLGLVFARGAGMSWVDGDLTVLYDFVALAHRVAARYVVPFARADRLVFDVLQARGEADAIRIALARRNRAGRFDRWMTRNIANSFHREGSLRRLVRYATW